MQPGVLFQVNETTNVFFMILRDCFISEFAKSDSMFMTSLRTGVIIQAKFRWQENSANQNADTINFH